MLREIIKKTGEIIGETTFFSYLCKRILEAKNQEQGTKNQDKKKKL